MLISHPIKISAVFVYLAMLASCATVPCENKHFGDIKKGITDKQQLLDWFGKPNQTTVGHGIPNPNACVDGAEEQWVWAYVYTLFADTLAIAFDKGDKVCSVSCSKIDMTGASKMWDTTHLNDIKKGITDKSQLIAWFGEPKQHTVVTGLPNANACTNGYVEYWVWRYVERSYTFGRKDDLFIYFEGDGKVCNVVRTQSDL